MAISDYIAALEKTKTYKEGLISYQEYSFESKAFGLFRYLPSTPYADDDRHVVVLEIRGEQPNVFKVLKEPKRSIDLTTKDVGRFLFIFIEMRPHTLKIEAPGDGYSLGDGHRFNSTLTITYQVADAEEFWKGGRDQLAEFEMTVTDVAKNFFLNRTSSYLVNNPSELKQSLEQHIQETGIKILKNNLEKSIWGECKIAGIRLVKVNADIYLSDSLREHLQRMHNRLYGEGGAVERKNIDQLIDYDTTFDPYGLRAVIMALDIRLLENFYSMKWSDAMRLVTERLAEKKEEYRRTVEDAEISRMRKIIATAQEVGLDEIDVKDLKAKLADKLMALADRDNSQAPSDSEYLKLTIAHLGSAGQITSDASRQSLPGRIDEKD